jgi:hypothetical protein
LGKLKSTTDKAQIKPSPSSTGFLDKISIVVSSLEVFADAR